MKPMPCPWCGKSPRFYPSHRRPGLEAIECPHDDCPVPDDAAITTGMPYQEIDAAVSQWNEWVAKDRERLK